MGKAFVKYEFETSDFKAEVAFELVKGRVTKLVEIYIYKCFRMLDDTEVVFGPDLKVISTSEAIDKTRMEQFVEKAVEARAMAQEHL